MEEDTCTDAADGVLKCQRHVLNLILRCIRTAISSVYSAILFVTSVGGRDQLTGSGKVCVAAIPRQ